MAERDRFELDLASALRRYAEEAPTQVRPLELARHFATAHPHRRAGIGHWRLVAVPRLAWIVLLAALLTALLAGTLFVGSQVQRRLPAVLPPIGQTFVCPAGSTPDKRGPVDQARPSESPHLSMAFDRRAGRLVALAGVDDAIETWTFDVCTNTWTKMHPDQEPFGWVELAYDIGSDVTIGVTSCRDCLVDPHGVVWAYNLQADTWNKTGVAPTDVTGLSYDPISGLVVALGDEDDPYTSPPVLWSYRVGPGTWAQMRQAGEFDLGVRVTYDASVDRVVAYSVDRAVGLFDIRTGTWSWSGAVAPGIYGSGMWGAPPAIAYDEAAQRTVVFGNGLAAYDATADRWEVLIDPTDHDPSDWLPSSMVYDPLNRRLVGLGRGVVVDQGGVVAFDLVAREWTILLEPSKVQPTPIP
jgi:hypothetical protein